MLMLGEVEEGAVMVMEAETVMVAVLLLCGGAVAVLRPPLVARSAGHQSHGAHRPDHTRGRTEDRHSRALNEIPKHSEKTPCRAITLLDRSTNYRALRTFANQTTHSLVINFVNQCSNLDTRWV